MGDYIPIVVNLKDKFGNSTSVNINGRYGENLLDILKVNTTFNVSTKKSDIGEWITGLEYGGVKIYTDNEGGLQGYVNGGLPFINVNGKPFFLGLADLKLEREIELTLQYDPYLEDLPDFNVNEHKFVSCDVEPVLEKINEEIRITNVLLLFPDDEILNKDNAGEVMWSSSTYERLEEDEDYFVTLNTNYLWKNIIFENDDLFGQQRIHYNIKFKKFNDSLHYTRSMQNVRKLIFSLTLNNFYLKSMLNNISSIKNLTSSRSGTGFLYKNKYFDILPLNKNKSLNKNGLYLEVNFESNRKLVKDKLGTHIGSKQKKFPKKFSTKFNELMNFGLSIPFDLMNSFGQKLVFKKKYKRSFEQGLLNNSIKMLDKADLINGKIMKLFLKKVFILLNTINAKEQKLILHVDYDKKRGELKFVFNSLSTNFFKSSSKFNKFINDVISLFKFSGLFLKISNRYLLISSKKLSYNAYKNQDNSSLKNIYLIILRLDNSHNTFNFLVHFFVYLLNKFLCKFPF